MELRHPQAWHRAGRDTAAVNVHRIVRLPQKLDAREPAQHRFDFFGCCLASGPWPVGGSSTSNFEGPRLARPSTFAQNECLRKKRTCCRRCAAHAGLATAAPGPAALSPRTSHSRLHRRSACRRFGDDAKPHAPIFSSCVLDGSAPSRPRPAPCGVLATTSFWHSGLCTACTIVHLEAWQVRTRSCFCTLKPTGKRFRSSRDELQTRRRLPGPARAFCEIDRHRRRPWRSSAVHAPLRWCQRHRPALAVRRAGEQSSSEMRLRSATPTVRSFVFFRGSFLTISMSLPLRFVWRVKSLSHERWRWRICKDSVP